MSLEEYENYLIENLGVDEEVISVVCAINGYNEQSLDDILYVKFGYRDLEQFLEYEDKETYNQYYGEEKEEDDEI
jgi:hypothetical protein